MKCPNCGIENPDSAKCCACGYDFQKIEMMESSVFKLASKSKKKLNLGHHLWIMFVLSFVLMIIFTFGSSFLFAFIGAVFMVGIPILISVIPAGIYWLVKHNIMPGLRIMIWILWPMSIFLVILPILSELFRL